MTIQAIIQKAIGAGYKKHGYLHQYSNWHGKILLLFIPSKLGGEPKVVEFQRLLLDPLFWQSLGKAMGWEVGCSYIDCWDRCQPWNGRGSYTGYWCHTHEEVSTMPLWLKYWHRFIDHLAEGKDIESFFNQF